jgi:prepilin-type N-terminal cleavage/methylation domain-containing protein
MNIKLGIRRRVRGWLSAFSLIEVMISVAIIGIMFVSLYGGIASGFAVINLARENLRATQIILEKMEAIRLYSWDQVNSNGFIPSTFSASFFPAVPKGTNSSDTNSVSSESGGTVYYGSVAIKDVDEDVPSAYAPNMRRVIIGITWKSGNVEHSREMETFVSEHGLQRYVY